MKMTVFISTVLVGALTLMSCGTKPETTEGTAPTQEQTTATVNNIGPSEVAKIVKEKNAILIDVRTPEEINEGIIEGATVFVDYKNANFASEIAKLDKSKTYIVYCRSGGRSAGASEMMIGQGFQSIYNLEGGITGWTGKVVQK
jgi:rhodanese-related sulfurtransferase